MWRTFHSAAAAALAIALLCDPSVIPEPERTVGAREGGSTAAAPRRCPGPTIRPDRVMTGEFGPEHARSYVMLPFEVPPGHHHGAGEVLP